METARKVCSEEPDSYLGVLVYGNINVDVTLFVESLPEPGSETEAHALRVGGGGSAANTAVALARLGIPAAMLGCVGNDEEGRAALKSLVKEGVDVSLVRKVSAPTGRVFVVVDARGERTMIALRGANTMLSPEDLSSTFLERVTWVHVSGGRLDVGRKLLEMACEACIPSSYDPGSAAYRAPVEAVRPLIERAGVLLVNETEYGALKRRSIEPSGIVVVKRGAKGSAILLDGEIIEVEAFRVRAVDTTGAGDAFNAGFLAGMLYGFELKECLILANAVAAIKVTREGARASPSIMETAVFLGNAGYRTLAEKLLSIGT